MNKHGNKHFDTRNMGETGLQKYKIKKEINV